MSDQTAPAGPTVSVDEVIAHVDRGDVFVLDVRKHKHGKQIYGAVQYDPKKLADAAKLDLPLPKGGGHTIVLYDEKGGSDELEALAEKLRSNGYSPVKTLDGGFEAYERTDGKTEGVTIEQPVPLVSTHQVER